MKDDIKIYFYGNVAVVQFFDPKRYTDRALLNGAYRIPICYNTVLEFMDILESIFDIDHFKKVHVYYYNSHSADNIMDSRSFIESVFYGRYKLLDNNIKANKIVIHNNGDIDFYDIFKDLNSCYTYTTGSSIVFDKFRYTMFRSDDIIYYQFDSYKAKEPDVYTVKERNDSMTVWNCIYPCDEENDE